MKVAVVGGGIIGVTTAYYLARRGQEVVVIERQPGAALETSFANAGQISPGYSSPWAAPGIPLKALKWMLSEHSPLVIRPRLDPFQWRWLLAMLGNCTAARYGLNKSRMLRIAEYSRRAFVDLRGETGIRYDDRQRGTLQLFRSEHQVEAAHKDIAVLEHMGVPYELLDVDGCVAAEPALARVRRKLAGGLRLPLDETGDCHLFTRELERRTAELGVEFRYDTPVERLYLERGEMRGVETARGRVQADAVVVACGSYSRALLGPLGIDIPVYPVKGYSLTVPITNPDAAPVSTLMDETHKVAITRLGERIRVAGTAELAGFDLRLRESRRRTVAHVVGDLFPDGGDVAKAEFWCGLRPMTPDSTPIVGPTRYRNLFLNTGHGTLGWTMSCGSSRLLADVISGHTPEISLDGLTVERYRRRHRSAATVGAAEPAPYC